MISQFGGQDWLSTIIWFVLFVVFIIFGPRLMVTQTILKLEKDVERIENIAKNSVDEVIKFASKKSGKKYKKDILSFMEFFSISPVNLDPYGIIKKLDFIVKQSDKRFKYFVNQLIPKASETEKNNLKNALEGAMTVHQLAKVVRHYLETIKKYKIFQLALLLQMQIPIITKLANSVSKATDAFIKGIPIGDSVAPLVVAKMISRNAKIKEYKEEEFIVAETKINGKKVYLAKAKGPGASTGYPGKFLTKFLKKNKIDRIITVDAAQKLEGEKTGSIAEGVGVAMGGVGVERYEIETIAVQKDIPIDAVVIKTGEGEALQPMKKEIFDAVPKAIDVLKNAIKRGDKKEKILVIGVGNTCGIGNNKKSVEKLDKILKEYWKKQKESERKKSKIF